MSSLVVYFSITLKLEGFLLLLPQWPRRLIMCDGMQWFNRRRRRLSYYSSISSSILFFRARSSSSSILNNCTNSTSKNNFLDGFIDLNHVCQSDQAFAIDIKYRRMFNFLQGITVPCNFTKIIYPAMITGKCLRALLWPPMPKQTQFEVNFFNVTYFFFYSFCQYFN